jgi:hypothetical protein
MQQCRSLDKGKMRIKFQKETKYMNIKELEFPPDHEVL